MTAVNDAVRFFLELGALAAIGYWARSVGNTTATKVLLSLGSVLFVAVVWAVFRADPGATVKVATPVRILVEVAVFAAATAALAAVGRVKLAIAFGIIAALNEVLNYTLG